MVRKSLVKIRLVDDSQVILEGLEQSLPATLDHMDVEVSSFNPPRGCTETSAVRGITQEPFDALLIDYRFEHAPLKGSEVGLKIKKMYPDRKVILMSNYEVAPVFGLDGICKKEDVLSTIERNLLRPIDVGIVGYGRFGDALLKQLLVLEEVRNIYLCSEKLFAIYGVDQFYDGIEQPRRNSKVIAPCKLEEVCEKSDVVAYCSSTLSGNRIVFLMNSTAPFERDRRIIFPTERNAESHFFASYKKSENKPLVLKLNNPPPYSIKMGVMQGIPPEKITCTCEPDLSRLIAAIPPHILERAIEEGIDFQKAAETLLTGVHGDPRLVYSSEYQEFMRKHSSDLDAALETSVQMANRAARARYGIGRAPDIPSMSNVHFFQDFARFRGHMGNFHLFRAFEYKGVAYEGVAMYPAKVNYHGGISVALDEEEIEGIGRDKFDRANAVYLAGQTDFYKQTMLLPAPGEVRDDVLHLDKLGFKFEPYKAEMIRRLQRMK